MNDLLQGRLSHPPRVEFEAGDTDAIDRATVAWLSHHGVLGNEGQIDSVLRTQPGKLAAYAFGYGEAQRIALCSDLIAWLFVFDDFYADGDLSFDPDALARKHRQYDSILDCEKASVREPFADSLEQLYGRFLSLAPQSWVRRLSASIRRYFHGCEVEARFRQLQTTPTLEQYLGYRDGSIGVYPMLDCIEFCEDACLPDALVSSPLVEQTRRVANLTIAITNDLYSARKEALETESFNTVLVLARQESLGHESAMARAIEVHDEHLHAYLSLEQRLLATADPELKKWLEGVRVWFDGNRRWSAECPRYNQVQRVEPP